MEAIKIGKLFVLLFAFLISANVYAQYANYGDVFTPALGKDAQSAEVSELIVNYHLEKANESHYLSKEGVELVLRNGLLNEIRLYRKSEVYGEFKAVLPYQLKFGMTPGEVKSVLGKPTVSYNTSGYSEYAKDNKIISCWMEEGRLSQVSLSLK